MVYNGGGSFQTGGAGGAGGKSRRDQIWEEKRKAKGQNAPTGVSFNNPPSVNFLQGGGAPPSGFQKNDRFMSPPQKF